MKKILLLMLVVLCVGSVSARPGPGTTGVIAVNASQVDGSYYQVIINNDFWIGFPLRMYWVKTVEWPAPSNVTVTIAVWVQGRPEGDPDFYIDEYGVQVEPNQTTTVIFHNPE